MSRPASAPHERSRSSSSRRRTNDNNQITLGSDVVQRIVSGAVEKALSEIQSESSRQPTSGPSTQSDAGSSYLSDDEDFVSRSTKKRR